MLYSFLRLHTIQYIHEPIAQGIHSKILFGCPRSWILRINWIISWVCRESWWVVLGIDLMRWWDASQTTALMISQWKITSTEVKMTTANQCSILLWVAQLGNAHMLRLQKSWRSYLTTINLGALEIQTLGVTTSRYRLQTTQPQMRFVKRWRRWELS